MATFRASSSRRRWRSTVLLVGLTASFIIIHGTTSFSATPSTRSRCRVSRDSSLFLPSLKYANNDNDWQEEDINFGGLDSNTWQESSNVADDTIATTDDDWEEVLQKRQDGSFWSDFSSNAPAEEETNVNTNAAGYDDDSNEKQLDVLASLQAEEVQFNLREANRADMARQMQEWGFDPATIASTLDVAVSRDEESQQEEVQGMQGYRESSYIEEDDLTMIESHTKVPKDADTNEPIQSRMVYVDEHSCIGCTNCAMIAQSTFFMEEENGRARVFEQWGDDETTIQIAIDTCPVDCIHYVSYPDLVQLEAKRRTQSINVLAGLVSRAERGAGSGVSASLSPRSFGNRVFTEPPKLFQQQPNYNYGSAGDQNEEEFQAKEQLRKFKAARQRLEEQRRRDHKIVDL